MICPHILSLTDLYQHITSDPPSSNISAMCLVIGFSYCHSACYMPSNFRISSRYFCPNGLRAIHFLFKYPIVMTSSDFNFTAQ